MSVWGMLAYSGMLKDYGGSLGKYYDVPSLDEFKKSNATAQAKLKPGYMRSSAQMSGQGVGEMVYSRAPKRVTTFRGKDGSNKYGMTSGTYIYKSPVAAAPAAAAPSSSPAPSAQGTSSNNFSQQLAAIKAQNQSSINALTKQMTDQKADYDARELAANKKISNLSSTVANAQSQYDPTKGMGSSNNINPALTIQEKSKSLSSGTQRYNRSQLSINNLNV